MNVFVLCTGRNGSTSFIEACKYITNYTASHQSLSKEIGDKRIDFPVNHIESDNRLSWFLGKLDKKYGDAAYYVHLKRNPQKTASSFQKKFGFGITGAFYPGLITRNSLFENEMKEISESKQLEICEDMIDTINTNIELFLKDKSNQISIDLEDVTSGFRQFWDDIGAEGDEISALASWDTRHNANEPIKGQEYTLRPKYANTPLTIRKVMFKISRLIYNFPKYVRDV